MSTWDLLTSQCSFSGLLASSRLMVKLNSPSSSCTYKPMSHNQLTHMIPSPISYQCPVKTVQGEWGVWEYTLKNDWVMLFSLLSFLHPPLTPSPPHFFRTSLEKPGFWNRNTSSLWLVRSSLLLVRGGLVFIEHYVQQLLVHEKCFINAIYSLEFLERH